MQISCHVPREVVEIHLPGALALGNKRRAARAIPPQQMRLVQISLSRDFAVQLLLHRCLHLFELPSANRYNPVAKSITSRKNGGMTATRDSRDFRVRNIIAGSQLTM